MREIINEKIVKVRKEQLCYGCGRKFVKGTNMSSCACKINSIMQRKYFCEGCHHTMIVKKIVLNDFWYGELLKSALTYEKNKGVK